MTDPIADLLTRIRNGQMARQESVYIPYSKTKEQVLAVLLKRGFIKTYKKDLTDKFPRLRVDLDEMKELTLTRKSKPGQRIYISKDEIKKVLNGYGVAVVSTSKGIVSGEEARKQGIGGELICEVY